MTYIPRFIELRGCINCDQSKEYKKRHGTDYGFDHELMVGCLISGCFDQGHSLARPFFDPFEGVEFLKKYDTPKVRENIRKYCMQVKERYGKYYEELGLSLDELIGSI